MKISFNLVIWFNIGVKNLSTLIVVNLGFINFFLWVALSNSLSVFVKGDAPVQLASVPESNSCIIGRLRMCNDDEDCVENVNSGTKPDLAIPSTTPLLHNLNSNSTQPFELHSSDHVGTCICRQASVCKRTQQSLEYSALHKSNTQSHSHHQNVSSLLKVILAIVLSVSTVGLFGFLIYYYGIRYGMINNLARQLGFTDNTQIEHQLLNRIPTGDDDDVELAI